MKKLFKRLYFYAVPKDLRVQISLALSNRKNKKFLSRLKNDILTFYSFKEQISPEQLEIITFLKNNPVKVFPYTFAENYDKNSIKIYHDNKKHLKYVIHEGKRLFFKRDMSENSIKSLYAGLLVDQDNKSPHKYLSSDFNVSNKDVIIDAGSAEGIFSLSVVDKVERIYLFESDPTWIEALQATFEPWENKVKIIQKYVSNESNRECIALDDFFEKHPFTFLKADIEGDELKLLKGLRNTLQSDKELKIVICTYHKQDDFVIFSKILEKSNFKLSTPPGYMIFYYDKNIKAPFLRRGVIRAQRHG